MPCQTLSVNVTQDGRPAASLSMVVRAGAALAMDVRLSASEFCREYDFTPPSVNAITTFAGAEIDTFAGAAITLF